MRFAERLIATWYTPGITPLAATLAPISFLFSAVAGARRTLFRAGLLHVTRLPVPVIVVGNISVGGTGKTPFTIALATALASRGYHPGIVSRGYGGRGGVPVPVTAESVAAEVGDEPMLLAARTHLPVWVGRDRVDAGRRLLAAHHECDVLIADDGLQHYALARDIEIALIDGNRGFGNGLLLPAGPLRESPARLASVDAVVRLAGELPPARGEYAMRLTGDEFVRVNAPRNVADAKSFRGDGVHAVAGIGNPARFFAQLRSLGIVAVEHAFPDHHRFTRADLGFASASAILMTEKDAVKCAEFADERFWMLPVSAHVDQSLLQMIEEKLRGFQAA
jgi:tetraacyldisaccharide 4'-kinase